MHVPSTCVMILAALSPQCAFRPVRGYCSLKICCCNTIRSQATHAVSCMPCQSSARRPIHSSSRKEPLLTPRLRSAVIVNCDPSSHEASIDATDMFDVSRPLTCTMVSPTRNLRAAREEELREQRRGARGSVRGMIVRWSVGLTDTGENEHRAARAVRHSLNLGDDV
jgi:hypothetical protein